MEEISRCTGHCCREFTLPHTPKRLRILFRERGRAIFNDIKFNYDWKEIQQVILMSKYLRMDTISPEGFKLKEAIPIFTCRNFDQESGNCNIYERRPRMCSNYPYGRKCEHKNCTIKYDEQVSNEIAEKQLLPANEKDI